MKISVSRRLILLCSLAVVAAFFSTGAALNIYSALNLQVSLAVQSLINGPLTSILYWLAFANGDWRAVILVVVLGLVIWWRWGRFNAIFLAGAGLISEINEALKVAFNTPRPPASVVQILAVEHSAAYPSGHSFFSMMFYGFIGYLALKNMGKKGGRAVCALCAFIILAVGFSRIYLGVHWIGDVIGGYLFGGFFLAALIWLYDFLQNKYKKAAVGN